MLVKGLTKAYLYSVGLREDLPRPLTVCQHIRLRSPPDASNIKVSQVPETRLESLTRDGISQHTKEEYQGLDNASDVIENKNIADSLDTSHCLPC